VAQSNHTDIYPATSS